MIFHITPKKEIAECLVRRSKWPRTKHIIGFCSSTDPMRSKTFVQKSWEFTPAMFFFPMWLCKSLYVYVSFAEKNAITINGHFSISKLIILHTVIK